MNFKILDNLTDERKVIELIKKTFDFESDLKEIEQVNNVKFLILKNNDDVIACTMITKKIDPIKNISTFYLDYICVDNQYRHQGIGTKMLNEVEKIAKEENINYLELTSNEKRYYAREMYQKFGFTIKDTDLFVKEL